MRTRSIALPILVGAAIAVSPLISRADRVASLHVHGGSDADRAALDKALHAALTALGHTTPTDAEILQGEGAAGAFENQSTGLVAIGKTTSSEWVVTVTIVSTAPKRVEAKACQVSSGRVESLARDLDPKGDLATQLREMLALMLRPQGVGDDPLPWESASAKAAASSSSSAPESASTPSSPSEPRFGATHPFALGVSAGAFDLAARGEGAQGTRSVGAVSVFASYALLANAPIVDVFLRVGSLFGPAGALGAEAGGRILARVSPSIAIGGALSAGLFAETSGNETKRALFGVAPVLAIAISPRFQLDFDLGSLRVAPGSGGAFVFVGGEANAVIRF